jgi:hypothetical protein
MSLATLFLRKRIPNPTQGNTEFLHGIVFDPGAEAWGTVSTVGDPLYTLRVFPQWNFQTMDPTQEEMVFQTLSLPDAAPAGFPFGGVLSEGLIHEETYPDLQGDYWS